MSLVVADLAMSLNPGLYTDFFLDIEALRNLIMFELA